MTVREHRKLWKNPLVFAAVLVGVMVNVFLLWYSEDSRNPYMDVSVSAYRSVYKQIEGMDTESAKAYVQGIIGEGDEEEDSSQEDEMPIEQENAFKLAAAEIANTGSYDVYLESKEEEAEARREFAIFQSADSDDYAAADTEQTLSVLRKFQGRYLEAGASRGVHMVLEFVQTDIVGLVVLLLGLSLAFMREKELGEHDFIRTMPEGRWHLMTAKYLSLCLFATETAVLMFGSSVVTAYRMYGFGGTHRYLQSVSGYIASGFSGNVGQALLAALAGKILNYILVITVLLTVMVFCRRRWKYMSASAYGWVSAPYCIMG